MIFKVYSCIKVVPEAANEAFRIDSEKLQSIQKTGVIPVHMTQIGRVNLCKSWCERFLYYHDQDPDSAWEMKFVLPDELDNFLNQLDDVDSDYYWLGDGGKESIKGIEFTFLYLETCHG